MEPHNETPTVHQPDVPAPDTTVPGPAPTPAPTPEVPQPPSPTFGDMSAHQLVASTPPMPESASSMAVHGQNPVAPAPPVSANSPAPAVKTSQDGMVLVMEWLTYAFWGWTVLMLSILTSFVITGFMSGGTYGKSGMIYPVAAVFVLLPLAFVCDKIYSKNETSTKSGASMAIMVIHAVIFALFGIASLIFFVFNIVTLLTGNLSSVQEAVWGSMISSLVIFTYYAVTFFRTLNLAAVPWIRRYFPWYMTALVVIFSVLSFLVPEKTFNPYRSSSYYNVRPVITNTLKSTIDK